MISAELVLIPKNWYLNSKHFFQNFQIQQQVENVNDNLFMGHFMANNALFEAIIQVIK